MSTTRHYTVGWWGEETSKQSVVTRPQTVSAVQTGPVDQREVRTRNVHRYRDGTSIVIVLHYILFHRSAGATYRTITIIMLSAAHIRSYYCFYNFVFSSHPSPLPPPTPLLTPNRPYNGIGEILSTPFNVGLY